MVCVCSSFVEEAFGFFCFVRLHVTATFSELKKKIFCSSSVSLFKPIEVFPRIVYIFSLFQDVTWKFEKKGGGEAKRYIDSQTSRRS